MEIPGCSFQRLLGPRCDLRPASGQAHAWSRSLKEMMWIWTWKCNIASVTGLTTIWKRAFVDSSFVNGFPKFLYLTPCIVEPNVVTRSFTFQSIYLQDEILLRMGWFEKNPNPSIVPKQILNFKIFEAASAASLPRPRPRPRRLSQRWPWVS